MPSDKAVRRRASHRQSAGDVVNDNLFEDLDLDVGQDSAVAPLQRASKKQKQLEDDIVFDRKSKKPTSSRNLSSKKAGNDADDADDNDDDNDDDDQVFRNQILAVHPREAHHNAKEGTRGAFGKKPLGKSAMGKKHSDLFGDDDDLGDDEDLDEAAIAAQMSRQDRKRLAEEDYELGLPEGLSGNVLPDRAEEDDDDAQRQGHNNNMTIDMQVNNVASQFAALSTSERLKMITKQSPEVSKLMEELEKNLGDLKDIFAPLRTALFERKKAMQAAGDSMLLEFLETKVQLMLSYCVHILFYLLLKIEGAKVEGHPVLKRLVELRVYLEKLHPVELRLQHSINRLLSGNSTQLTEGARLKQVRPINDAESADASKSGKYVARKTAPVISDLRDRRRAEHLADEMRAIEREEERTMHRKRMTRAEAAKFSGNLDQVPLDTNMQEEEDSYLANASSFLGGRGKRSNNDDDFDEDDDELPTIGGKSLIERLRARTKAQKEESEAAGGINNLVSGKNNKQNQKELKKRLRAAREEDEEKILGQGQDDDFEGDDFEGDGEGDDEGDDVLDFDELEMEQEERENQQHAQKKHRAENPYQEPTSDRREADDGITKHRGLTKARPKDRKTPRSNQRRKFNIGLRAAKSQNKRITDGADRETASAPLKTHVVHSTRF